MFFLWLISCSILQPLFFVFLFAKFILLDTWQTAFYTAKCIKTWILAFKRIIYTFLGPQEHIMSNFHHLYSYTNLCYCTKPIIVQKLIPKLRGAKHKCYITYKLFILICIHWSNHIFTTWDQKERGKNCYQKILWISTERLLDFTKVESIF